MTILKTLLIYGLIIIIGSIVTQIVYSPVTMVFDNRDFQFVTENFIVWVIFALMYSGLFSIPGQSILILTNEFLKLKRTEKEKFKKVFLTVYVTVSLITFGLLIYSGLDDEFVYMVTSATIYFGTGLLLWTRELKKLPATPGLFNGGRHSRP